jgi:peroxiredoxin
MTSTRIKKSLCLCAAAWLAGLGPAALAAQQPPAIGSPAPDFRLDGIDGKTHSLSEFGGKIIVLEWTNPGCPVVQRVYKAGRLPAVQKELETQGVIWLAVNSTNPQHPNYQAAEALKETYRGWQAQFTTLLMDPDGKVGKAFGARTTPHLFVIDKEGRLAYNGAFDDDPMGNNPEPTNYVRLAVAALFSGKPVAMTTTKSYGCSVKYAQ